KASGGSGGQAAIGVSGLHLPGCRQVTMGKPIIPIYVARLNAFPPEARIKERAAARAFLFVYERDVPAAEVRDAPDAFGIAGGREDALLPFRKRDYGDRILRKQAANFRQIRFPAALIPKVRARHMNAPLLQQH